jgi:hypothetical protein
VAWGFGLKYQLSLGKMSDEPKKPGKYKRAFDWRLSEDPKKLSPQAAGAMARLASSDFPDILEDFLSISRKRQKNPTALARLQIYMLEELLVQEGAVKQYRSRLKELEASSVSTSGKDEIEREVAFCERERFFHRMYANAIRAIGDGIAWRALGYDRAVMRLLGERQTKQHLSSEGTVQELREWSYHFETGSGIAILNALTNCLAMGDVTVVKEDESVEIVEVKSSKTKSSRKIRQKHAMSEVVTLIATGEGKNEERDVQIEEIPIKPRHSLKKLEDLLDEAGNRGWAAKRLTDYLYVEAFDFRKIKALEDVRELTEKVRQAAIGEWEKRGDLIIDMNSLDIIAYSPNSAPFSVFPFKARTCVELLIGAKFYVSFLNLSVIENEFVNSGWTLEKDFKTRAQEGLQESIIDLRKGPFHCNVPPADLMRMQMETLDPKTLISAIEWKYRQGPTQGTWFLLAVYDEERKMWN